MSADATLAGRHVLLTRADDGSGDDVRALASLGARVSALPLVQLAPLDPVVAPRPEGYAWVAFTSQHAVRRFAAVADVALWRAHARAHGAPRVAAVGGATAAALADVGLEATLVPDRATGAALGDALVAAMGAAPGARVCFPCAESARADFPTRLRAAGATVDALPLYRTEPDVGNAAEAARAVVAGSVDALVLSSGSAARALAARGVRWEEVAARVVAVGPSTAADARAAGLPVHAVAAAPTPAAVADAVVAALGDEAARRMPRPPAAVPGALAAPVTPVLSAHA